MTTTTQTAFPFPSTSIGVGDLVECFSRRVPGTVSAILDANIDGRVALLVETADGRQMVPFIDECRVRQMVCIAA